MLEILIEIALTNDSNAITKYCVKKIEGQEAVYSIAETADWNKIAACASDLRVAQRQLNYEDLRKFLEKNPHYRYPGAALPNGKIKALDECWGKDRKYHTDKGC